MSVRCGNCKNRHETSSQVRACYGHDSAVAAATAVAVLERTNDGFYTVVFGDDDYVTIRLRTQDQNASFAPGTQIASYLSGPDNESDYRGFAFVKPDRFHVWKRFKGNSRLHRALEILLSDSEVAGQEYAMRSSRCRRCNRTLTVPASLHRGFGPVCAEAGDWS